MRVTRETLLRIPAAVVCSSTLLALGIGDLLFLDSTAGNAAVAYGIIAAWALPFLIPWSWATSRLHFRVLRLWLGAAALAMTARIAYLIGGSFLVDLLASGLGCRSR